MKDSCKTDQNSTDSCDILQTYINKRGGSKISYRECLYFLNNNTHLTQVQIFECLNKQFQPGTMSTIDKWFGIA